MEPKPYAVTENAKLQTFVRGVDAQGMNRWVEELLQRYAKFIRCGKYRSVFCCKDIEDKDIWIGAAGRLAGLRIQVSRTAIQGEVDKNGEPVFTVCETFEESLQSIPFARVFALCNSLRDKMKELVEPAFHSVPVVGGLKSILLSDEPQEIVNYYLPEIELFGKDSSFCLFSAAYIPEQLPLPQAPKTEAYSACRIAAKTQYPGKEEYLVRMAGVLEKLKSGFVQKVVVARKCTVKTDESFDKLDYTAYLLDNYFQEYFYFFRQGGEEQWVGISPEIIMKQKGGRAVTKPLAGTRKKGEDDALNEQARKELTSSSKDSIEHEHALYFMVEQLQKANIGEVRIDKKKTVLETPYAFHIKSEISIELKQGVSCFDIMSAIYPPATVWGIPVDRAESILAETEPFKREYYTGLYGYWNYEGDADIALVIRSAKLQGDTVSVYAGGGIVECSDAESEYEETVSKMRPLLGYFTEK